MKMEILLSKADFSKIVSDYVLNEMEEIETGTVKREENDSLVVSFKGIILSKDDWIGMIDDVIVERFGVDIKKLKVERVEVTPTGDVGIVLAPLDTGDTK